MSFCVLDDIKERLIDKGSVLKVENDLFAVSDIRVITTDLFKYAGDFFGKYYEETGYSGKPASLDNGKVVFDESFIDLLESLASDYKFNVYNFTNRAGFTLHRLGYDYDRWSALSVEERELVVYGSDKAGGVPDITPASALGKLRKRVNDRRTELFENLMGLVEKGVEKINSRSFGDVLFVYEVNDVVLVELLKKQGFTAHHIGYSVEENEVLSSFLMWTAEAVIPELEAKGKSLNKARIKAFIDAMIPYDIKDFSITKLLDWAASRTFVLFDDISINVRTQPWFESLYNYAESIDGFQKNYQSLKEFTRSIDTFSDAVHNISFFDRDINSITEDILKMSVRLDVDLVYRLMRDVSLWLKHRLRWGKKLGDVDERLHQRIEADWFFLQDLSVKIKDAFELEGYSSLRDARALLDTALSFDDDADKKKALAVIAFSSRGLANHIINTELYNRGLDFIAIYEKNSPLGDLFMGKLDVKRAKFTKLSEELAFYETMENKTQADIVKSYRSFKEDITAESGTALREDFLVAYSTFSQGGFVYKSVPMIYTTTRAPSTVLHEYMHVLTSRYTTAVGFEDKAVVENNIRKFIDNMNKKLLEASKEMPSGALTSLGDGKWYYTIDVIYPTLVDIMYYYIENKDSIEYIANKYHALYRGLNLDPKTFVSAAFPNLVKDIYNELEDINHIFPMLSFDKNLAFHLQSAKTDEEIKQGFRGFVMGMIHLSISKDLEGMTRYPDAMLLDEFYARYPLIKLKFESVINGAGQEGVIGEAASLLKEDMKESLEHLNEIKDYSLDLLREAAAKVSEEQSLLINRYAKCK